ncbi:MAG TPA: TonB-dependent receptor [Bryobacterales bacterium]|nr:TonB-dependent receptor [Bryobacterales bacterium]
MKRFALALIVCLTQGWAQQPPSSASEAPKIDPIRTTITVREKVESPAPAYITELTDESIASRPGVNIDDRLRDVPGFSLFRRSSSLSSHPTSQGVSLRGIGSSAASRTLVLFDGLPANDPFGGWVYWSRFNPDYIESIEISRGASTSVFGDRAMGGAILLRTPTPEARHVTGAFEAGSAGIADARGGFTDLWGPVGFSTSVRGFRSDGFYIVPEDVRGSVDRKADLDFITGDMRLDFFGDKHRLSLRSNVIAEQRINGTVLRENSSSLGTVGGHYQRQDLSVTGYHSRGVLRSTFTSVSNGGNNENLVLVQSVPSEDTGGSVVWSRSRTNWKLMLGADTHRASGVSNEIVVFSGARRALGGKLWQQGLFVQADANLNSRTQVYGGLRHDFADRGNDFWSPRGGIAFSEGPRRWRAAAYRSFRSPTLNEFFRLFRVGDITTLANPNLRPETMAGVDGGMDWRREGYLVRTTLFWHRIEDLIGNATVQTAPTIIRRRENFGEATSRGLEVELQKMFGPIRTEAAYLYVDAQLDNNVWMSQVPRHQGSFQLLYSSGRTLFSGGVRSYDAQFEDDLNRFLLPGFATVQVMVKHRLAHGFSALLAAENLLDRTFLVGFTPTPTTGNPRLLRVGVKWESGS